ncbi:MAG TPA: four helix bundle protein [Candidatus Methylomirabilis sp.]|nr:four helix bundle protein [Candidatus Methylomirabilis sp.]
MRTFRFFDFPVYRDAVNFYISLLSILTQLSDFVIKDQAKRAGLSIILNIAEGSAVKSDKEFARYLEKSLGSANEVAACLDVMFRINLISYEVFIEMINKCELISKQLGGFKKSLLP